MTSVKLARELAGQGYPNGELARLVRRQELERVRRGAYAPPVSDPNAATRHLRLLEATARQSDPGLVVSHLSAAVLHDLPVWPTRLERVHLTRNRRGGGQRRRYSEIHALPLAEGDVVSVDAYRVTSLPRTVLDLACCLPEQEAVAAGDVALQRGITRPDLDLQLGEAGPRAGIVAARRAFAWFDERAESPGESFSRVVFHRAEVPAPVLQFVVFAPDGSFVARTDFGWPGLRTIWEFDGRLKYARGFRPDRSPEDVLYAEKLREDRLRDLGWQVVRWTWGDLADPTELLARLDRAFARGRLGSDVARP